VRPHEIDDVIVYAGRRYVVRGFTDLGVVPPFIYLGDVETEEVIRVPLDELVATCLQADDLAAPGLGEG
jgi:hypothetical protein